ncbi:hypothetical protein GQ53DRAFT_746237 [Thozetella sp. PMI_491]|nr:hypothetical protein GQ53DRAFT_746237 [Thozetella sp. PMI_491]
MAANKSTRNLLPHDRRDGTLSMTNLDGAAVTRVLPDSETKPGRSFSHEVIFHPDHPMLLKLGKPPAHFHPYQEEYVEVLGGTLVVDVDGVEHVVKPGDPEFTLRRGVNHRLYAPQLEGKDPPAVPRESIRMLLSGEDTPNTFKLDLAFFENWYAYQEEVFVHWKPLDLIQVLSMFDAGDTYVSLPWWVPFRSTISLGMGIVLGRWIGGMLGYQPFYEEWTTDWEQACERMETSIFQKRFSNRKKTT